MGIRLNLFCNQQIAQSEKYKDNFEEMNWPDAPKRDQFGIIIKEKKENANLSK